MGQFWYVMATPVEPIAKWAEEIPNHGLIRYLMMFNRERVLLTGTKAIGEVLVTKSYEFVKPKEFRHGLGMILGIGILLAEGEEHKVSISVHMKSICIDAGPRRKGRTFCRPLLTVTSRTSIRQSGTSQLN
jgi:hypothetical protein